MWAGRNAGRGSWFLVLRRRLSLCRRMEILYNRQKCLWFCHKAADIVSFGTTLWIRCHCRRSLCVGMRAIPHGTVLMCLPKFWGDNPVLFPSVLSSPPGIMCFALNFCICRWLPRTASTGGLGRPTGFRFFLCRIWLLLPFELSAKPSGVWATKKERE